MNSTHYIVKDLNLLPRENPYHYITQSLMTNYRMITFCIKS
jgi:hypothetical protein